MKSAKEYADLLDNTEADYGNSIEVILSAQLEALEEASIICNEFYSVEGIAQNCVAAIMKRRSEVQGK